MAASRKKRKRRLNSRFFQVVSAAKMEGWAKSKSLQRRSGRRQQAGELVLCIDNGRSRAGSTWSNSSGVNVGNLGTGTLTIAEGGIFTGPIVIATNASAIGTINIGAGAGNPAAAPGTLTAPSLAFGAGTGMINFNHTFSDYVFAPAITGNGTVNVLAGTTIFTGANSYSGTTNVNAGRPALETTETVWLKPLRSSVPPLATDRDEHLFWGGIGQGCASIRNYNMNSQKRAAACFQFARLPRNGSAGRISLKKIMQPQPAPLLRRSSQLSPQ
jgi:hypothetical protein